MVNTAWYELVRPLQFFSFPIFTKVLNETLGYISIFFLFRKCLIFMWKVTCEKWNITIKSMRTRADYMVSYPAEEELRPNWIYKLLQSCSITSLPQNSSKSIKISDRERRLVEETERQNLKHKILPLLWEEKQWTRISQCVFTRNYTEIWS